MVLPRSRLWIIFSTNGATGSWARPWPLSSLVCRCSADLSFDFNPLNLRSKHVELVSTLLDLMNVPDTSPNTIDVLEPNLAEASAMAEKLRQLPEVAKVRTLESFVPDDQDDKLAIIDDASFFLQNTLNPDPIDPAPTPADTLAAISKPRRAEWGGP